jgi:hypothetical protein
MKSFKQFLTESEGIYDAMADTIQQRITSEHRKKHGSGQISSPEMTREHIKKYKLHDSLLEQVPGRSRIDHHDFDHDAERISNPGQIVLNPNQENKFRIYRFYVPKKGSPTAPHHVAVKIAPRSNHDLIDPSSFPNHKDISFSIDGEESTNQMPETDFESHHAVYSGLMDAIAHHHFDTGTHPDEYVFAATARDKNKERAKSRRYDTIKKVLGSFA